MTDREKTIDTLQRHADTIRAFGARSLYLYGSAARDDMRIDSDVDLFLDYDRESNFDLIALAKLQLFLSEVLHREVDLTTRGGLHPLLREHIERTSVRVL